MDYLITEAVALKANREEHEEREKQENQAERDHWKKEQQEKLKKFR